MSDDRLLLFPGDGFCTRNPMLLGRIINWVQRFQSKDNQSEYGHAGIIIGCADPSRDVWRDGIPIDQAVSFEALWTNRRQNFHEAYKGRKVLVGRHELMTEERFLKGWEGIRHHEGTWYAGHRMIFFLVPPFGKYLSAGLAVCSEMFMKFFFKAGIYGFWKNWNPDDVADMIHRWRDWEIVHEKTME
ncbi:MAG: hypothetical protein JW884_06240 [Deltaproteobacteria bacterium]|nr:hypothetical protein [Deltaproteobacteria bacterium]